MISRSARKSQSAIVFDKQSAGNTVCRAGGGPPDEKIEMGLAAALRVFFFFFGAEAGMAA